ncbi:MAG: type II toxin-antitoxin system RelE/ParE family toxin, partial [Cyanobacteria bacterium J06648_11]
MSQQPWRIEFYSSASGNVPVVDWLKQQSPKVRAEFQQRFRLLQERGTAVGLPHVRPLGDKLYEIRLKQDKIIYRVIYFAFTERRFVMLHGFQKKQQSTPRKELD